MHVEPRVHASPTAFLQHATRFLDAGGVQYELVFAILAAVASQPAAVRLVTLDDDQSVVGFALQTPPRKWLVSRLDDGGVSALVGLLQQRGWAVPGFFAPDAVAAALATRWSAVCGVAPRRGRLQRIHELRRVSPVPAVTGAVRTATARDAAVLDGWARSFVTDVGADEQPDEIARTVTDSIASGQMHVWDDGGLAAMARARRTRAATMIGPVYTPPERRRAGYATALVAAVSAGALAGGSHACGLFTDLANATSNAIYRRIGYLPVADWTDWYFA